MAAARTAIGLLLLVIAGASARASFHLASIVEIYTGSSQCPTCQYVVIMCYADFQDVFATVEVTAFDRNGSALPNFAVFTSNLPSTMTNQRSALVATADAVGYFGVPPNQTATGALDPAGGVVCFRRSGFTPDCVSYGAYVGNPNVGGSPAGPPAPRMPSGWALRRDFKGNATLEATDDTNNSAVDFFLSGPRPRNFNNVVSTILSAVKDAGGGTLTLTWSPVFASHAVHRTLDPATVHASSPVSVISTPPYRYTESIGAEPLVCFVVKP